ncbi:MAG: glycosyltransferase family protein [Thermodesulfobacteriota bacterium]
MAKILYGVHGTGHGHAMRALTVARHFPEHDFLFVSHGSGAEILRPEFPVVECPSLVTVVRAQRVAKGATLAQNFLIWRQRHQVRRQLLELLDQYQPDAVLNDYEFFLPQVCREAGLPCLSLDHQHVIPFCRHAVPPGQWASYLTTRLIIQHLYSRASHYLVTSFFRPRLKPGLSQVRLAPPLLRESVRQIRPQAGEHVVAYQGYSTFARFFPLLQAIPRPVLVYGFDREHREGNLTFRRTSEEGFLADLAACRYVVCGGSHSLLSEALFYGKPVLSFPIKDAFEQFLNAFYVNREGYGNFSQSFRPDPKIIPAFEAKLGDFQKNIQKGQFCGNQEIFALVQQFIDAGNLDLPDRPLQANL